MDTFDLINLAIAYIEEELTQPLTTAEVAAATGYSRAHLGRLFLEMTGETLAGYMRKRRLSEAARKLLTTRTTILDLALDYQFESQEAFTRSFKRHFRLSPGAYRKRGRLSGAFHKITLRRQHIHRLYGESGKALPLDRSLETNGCIVPVQLHAILMQRTSPAIRTQPFDTLYLWYA